LEVVLKFLPSVTQILEKADSLNFFTILAIFVFFLDGIFVSIYGKSILSLTWSYAKGEVDIGALLVILCAFSFYLSGLIPFCHNLLAEIILIFPRIKFFNEESTSGSLRASDSYVKYNKLKTIALEEGNSVALTLALDKEHEVNEQKKLESYCFGFVIITLANLTVGLFSDTHSLVQYILVYSEQYIHSTLYLLISMSFVLFILYAFYLGVMRGCCIIRCPFYDDEVYYPSNKEQK